MKVLVVGGGGREHALVWKIKQSPLVSQVFCAPGNAGTSFICENVSIGAGEIERLVQFAKEEKIGLTVIGPERALTMGIVDVFEKEGLRIFGPTQKAAELEGSKSFAKEIMKKYRIPTASFDSFTDADQARDYLGKKEFPLVVKADGLAAGKGVVLCGDKEEALAAINRIMDKKEFGSAGGRIVIEDFLEGEEASYLAFVDGEHVLPMASSQDHKAVFDEDRGPNTGGMGAYSPAPIMDRQTMDWVTEKVALPVIEAMKNEGKAFRGILYAGLMITGEGPKVLEFNCRFGDPETQPVLLRMKSDIVPLFQACMEGKLDKYSIEWTETSAVCVVMASQGYPGTFKKGLPVTGLDEKGGVEGAVVFHAGADLKDGRVVTNGGRVLGVTAEGRDIESAIDNAYNAVTKIQWDGVYFRKDIGKKALT